MRGVGRRGLVILLTPLSLFKIHFGIVFITPSLLAVIQYRIYTVFDLYFFYKFRFIEKL